MSGEHEAIIVERRSYRRRRMADAARLLPVFGVAFLSIPLLWSGAGDGTGEGTGAGVGEGATSTTSAMFYIFGIWALLAIASAAISRHLRPDDAGPDGGR